MVAEKRRSPGWRLGIVEIILAGAVGADEPIAKGDDLEVAGREGRNFKTAVWLNFAPVRVPFRAANSRPPNHAATRAQSHGRCERGVERAVIERAANGDAGTEFDAESPRPGRDRR